MNKALRSAEFEVNFVNFDGFKVEVSGRNYEQDISIGDIFSWVYRITVEEVKEHEFIHLYSDERFVSLRVEAIEAYRRDVDILGHGGTGRLTLVGDGYRQLAPYSSIKPRSYDLLRVEKYDAARRPIGLAEGEFVVPDDFDDPLPDEIQQLFEGSWEPYVETHG